MSFLVFQQHKIFNTIVQFIAIYVVYYFASYKRTTYVFLHYVSMLSDFFTSSKRKYLVTMCDSATFKTPVIFTAQKRRHSNIMALFTTDFPMLPFFFGTDGFLHKRFRTDNTIFSFHTFNDSLKLCRFQVTIT